MSLLLSTANVVVMWALASAAASGRISLGELVTYAHCAIGTSMIAFGGLNWALDGASAPVGAVARLEPAMAPEARCHRANARSTGDWHMRFVFAMCRLRIPAARTCWTVLN